jgi:hypothetical protein
MLGFIGGIILIVIVFAVLKGFLKGLKSKMSMRICKHAYEGGVPYEFSMKAVQNLGALDKVLKQVENDDPSVMTMPTYAQYAMAIIIVYKKAEQKGLLD